ncbi:uncharacterized protein LOC106056212 [Biomphalaria glabrata]|uniref:Uncharacterized protein LOC106056212 n=1 Tax=Biomphalaria glabrata TaxID=6526 RepID=A0A9U8E0H9_BIOGL|nr:uncharacterized protein LOC106056212 [Biomphalaria glabrata]KAI8783114.1 CDP-diacylglycerol--inositol 3-phosphatidyltransferase 2 [Biomphalaria glabrata]
MALEVLFYIPNVIGYVRILLAIGAFLFYHDPTWFTILYTASISLDGIDGYLARRLHQCSAFGAWFDVVIDLFTRGYLWCALFQGGYLIACLEWMTFMSTHSRGEHWKIPRDNFPWLVKNVMADEFKTHLGFFTVGSLHLLPLWLYISNSQLLMNVLIFPEFIQTLILVVLLTGRLLCSMVEFFYIKAHILYLLNVNDQQQG